jgi:hypothetical protein
MCKASTLNKLESLGCIVDDVELSSYVPSSSNAKPTRQHTMSLISQCHAQSLHLSYSQPQARKFVVRRKSGFY